MRPLKLVLAVLIGTFAVVAVLGGFVVVAAIGVVALLILGIRRLLTGKPAPTVRFERVRPRPAAGRTYAGSDVIDVEATPVAAPPKRLGE